MNGYCRKLGVCLLALALTACGEEAEPDAHDGLEATDESPVMTTDAGGTTRSDAGSTTDGGKPRADAGGSSGAVDAGAPREPDAGKPDAGKPDAGSADAGAVASGDAVPSGEHCAPVAQWEAASAQFEDEVLRLTNEARAIGHNCDSEGSFGPAGPLKTQPQLRCAARLHAKYMVDTGEFAHEQSMTGLDPFERMKAAGYSFRNAGENIAAGQTTPKQVVDGWLDSDGHCRNIMDPAFTELGVGYAARLGGGGRGSRAMPYWVQNFGRPGR